MSTFGNIPQESLERIAHFERVMKERRYSKATIKTYVSMMKQFLSYYNTTPWNEITPDDVSRYNYEVYILMGRSFSTQNQAINAIKLFYMIEASTNLVPEDIARPRKQKRLPVVLAKEEVEAILKTIGNQKHKTLLMLIYACGLRIGETLQLEFRDISRKEMLIYIRGGKGQRDRRIPMSEKLLHALEDYYHAYKPRKYLFEGRAGKPYSASSARKIVKRAVKKAGIKRDIKLHTFRHSYATHMMEKGVAPRYIQDILGHKSLKTTMQYLHVSGKRLGDVGSPLDDLDL